MRRKINLTRIAVYVVFFGTALVAVGVGCTVISQIAKLTWEEIMVLVGAVIVLSGLGVIWFDN